jgi:hypothetical protein
MELVLFACKICPLNFLGKGYSPRKKFSLMRPPKGTSVAQSASFDSSCVQIGSVFWSVGRVSKKREGKVR